MRVQPIQLSAGIYKMPTAVNNYLAKTISSDLNCQSFCLSNCFYYPVSFSSTQKREFGSEKTALKEKSGAFKVSMFPNLTCPACGNKVFNRAMMKRIYFDLTNMPSDDYLEYIGQYRDYMRPVELSVYDEIYEMSKKPGATKDIRELIVSLRQEKLPLLQKVQMRQIKKMRALARTLPHDEKEVLLHKLSSLEKIVKKNKSNSPFRRRIMIDRMSKVKIKNPRKYKKLQVYLSGFPSSKDMNSAWIVKYSGTNKECSPWTSQEIALRFLSSSLANTDHILAYDIENNHDDITNYMSMHSGCNAEKSNKPFIQWLNEDKDNRIKHMQQYFSEVDQLISERKLNKKKYRHYVALATQTIEDASKGQVTSSMLVPEKNSSQAIAS